MLQSVLDSQSGATLTIGSVLLCSAVSLALGLVIALIYMYKNNASRNLVIALVLLPVIVQTVIMLVNGSTTGTGIAVLGAFSLVRFRSVPGSAKDISCIFFAMAVGVATGMGYLTLAAVATGIIGLALIVLTVTGIGRGNQSERDLRVTIPENLDYTEIFDDVFGKYTSRNELIRVKTTNLGSMYELRYRIALKPAVNEKNFLDELRCRNGNLTIVCGRVEINQEETL